MTSNINLNLNQSPYFDDYDETKDFHQVLYKPAVAVQARELSQEQTILRNQIKRFGDHVFANGSRVSGGNLHIDLEYEYVKLQATYNNVSITPSLLNGKTIIGNTSGTIAKVVNYADIDSVTGDPDTVWVKYLSGGAITDGVQGIKVTNQGSGYSSAPLVTIGSPNTGSDQATGTAVLSYDQKVIGVNITNVGSGYTSVPSVTIAGDATGTSTLNKGAAFLADERITAIDLSSAVYTALTSPTGKGSAVSNDDGYYYFNGNFIRSGSASLILDKYTNTPSYRIGFQVTASIIDSGDDTTLLDNAQGAYNYAAPGADRLKYALELTKKTTSSTDDTDFIEIMRLVGGVKHADNPYPIYSVLEETFARRTFDESGSYTVRHFPIQLKLSTDSSLTQAQNDALFVSRLDPGKAYVYGHEHETMTSTDITVNRARDTKAVNNFDRIMQYGNYAIVNNLTGLYNVTTNEVVDLHKVAHNELVLTSPATYATTKIGTAKVRQLNPVSNYAGPYHMYLYDVSIISGDFDDVQSIIIPESPLSGAISITSKCNIDNTGKVGETTTATVTSVVVTGAGVGYTSIPTVTFSGGGGTTQATGTAVLSGGSTGTLTSVTVNTPGVGYTSNPGIVFSTAGSSTAATAAAIIGGDTKLFDTDFNTLVFKLAQNNVETIRDSSSNIDTGYQIQRVFTNEPINSGVAVLTSAGSNETFYGTGAVSSTIKHIHYHATDAAGTLINLNATSPANATVTVHANGQSVTIFTGDNSLASIGNNFIITMNIGTKQEKTKTLVKNSEKPIVAPSAGVQTYTSLDISDVNAIKAIYDSGDPAVDAVSPKLVISNYGSNTFIAGETITGGTSGATGTVITHSTVTLPYVVTEGTFVATEVITGSANSFTATVDSLTAGSTEVSSNWTLDTGQRDNFYDHGRIQRTGATAPVGRILIIMDYFSHSGTGYFSVDSYTASGLADPYVDIPAYTSPISGKKLELRDCIDFRPRRADGGTTMQNIEIPYPNENWQADYSYYMPRIDILYISKEKVFGIHEGISADAPVPPFTLDHTMNLYRLDVPAYTFKPSDVAIHYIENKRYTMKDISRLEKRLNNVEYYTALSLLERDAESLVIKDNAGLDRFKNGIIVDDFAGHSVGDVFNTDYKCSIDFKERELRPPFESNIADLTYIPGSSTGVIKTGDLITLPFTSTAFISQTQASTFLNVNPFNVTAWVGVLDLDPPNDNWVATNNRPEVIVNATGENDAWEALAGLGFGSQWNDWQDSGTGRNERLISSGARFDPMGLGGRGAPRRPWLSEQTFTIDQQQTRTGVRTEIVGSETVESSLGERVVNVSVLPFIRAKNITISVTGMKPNTRVYPFFDKEAVITYCTPSGGSVGGNIYTDDSGSVSGLVFAIPCPDAAQEAVPPLLIFRTGERQFLLTDDPNGNLETASTYAERMYQAQGLLQTKENIILSSRVPRISTGGVATSTRINTRTETRNVIVGWIDPLAQTFLVDENIYPDGVYLSSLDLYFKTKDDGNVPVSIHIRDVEQGLPTNRVVPFSDVSLNPASVNVSDTAATSTNFPFSDPCYLMPGEYAIIIMTNSLKYESWVAEMGQNLVGTTRKVSEQPYAGVFFRSQNASTWEQDQNKDLTFVLNRCKFTTAGAHEAVFHNSNSADYKMDTMHLTSQEVHIDKTNIEWAVKTTDQSSLQLSSAYAKVVMNDNHNFTNQQVITSTAGSFIGKATLSVTSDAGDLITPVLDTKRLSAITIQNKINNLTTNEIELPAGGDALARYITRRVTLTDGFDATDLKIYLTINKPAGTNVTVYYKVLSQFDPAVFDDKLWVAMNQTSQLSTVALTDDEFIAYEYSTVGGNTNYVVSGATYTTFKTFTIKIVMTSNSTATIPRIADMRTIALA
jgi:hypothetical protein